MHPLAIGSWPGMLRFALASTWVKSALSHFQSNSTHQKWAPLAAPSPAIIWDSHWTFLMSHIPSWSKFVLCFLLLSTCSYSIYFLHNLFIITFPVVGDNRLVLLIQEMPSAVMFYNMILPTLQGRGCCLVAFFSVCLYCGIDCDYPGTLVRGDSAPPSLSGF